MQPTDPASNNADGPLSYTARIGQQTHTITGTPVELTHPYLTEEIDKPIFLAATSFWVDKKNSMPLQGELIFTWKPEIGVQASGKRQASLDEDWRYINEDDETHWHPVPELLLEQETLPIAKVDAKPKLSHKSEIKLGKEFYISTHVRTPNIGDGSALREVRFLIPNTWRSLDGFMIRSDGSAALPRRDRMELSWQGWRIRIDRPQHVTPEYLNDLQQCHGYASTHIGRITRESGDRFDSKDIHALLYGLNVALSFTLGQRTSCILPVGYKDSEPCWTDWSYTRVDPAKPAYSFRDPTIASVQFMEVGELVLSACTDSLKSDTLRLCLSYLLQANAHLDVELRVGACISALLLLAHTKYVAEDQRYSSTGFSELGAEGQIRTLAEDAQISTDIPTHLAYLESVAAEFKERDGQTRDALACVIKMRNEVMHPKRDRMIKWTPYQWSECGTFAVHLLETALLFWLGFKGDYHSRIERTRNVGATEQVPWANNTASPDPRS